MALPQSEMSLLQSSTSIGTSRKSKKQILQEISQRNRLRTNGDSEKRIGSLDPVRETEGDDANLVGTSWRKRRRKRRKLKVEKMILDPKPPPVLHRCDPDEGESSDEQQEDEEESDNSSGGMDGISSLVVTTLILFDRYMHCALVYNRPIVNVYIVTTSREVTKERCSTALKNQFCI